MNEDQASANMSAPGGEDPPSAQSRREPGQRERRVTMRDVAKRANVSVGTISRVINKNPSVRPDIRNRVEEAMAALGYVPDAVAQSMRAQATMAVGCMVSDVSNPLFASAVRAAELVFHRAGYTMMLTNSQDRLERECEILSLFRRRRLDGIICTLSDEKAPELLSRLKSPEMPAVLIERSVEAAVDSVATDHYGGVLKAMEYLFVLGHRRICLITVTEKALPGRERVRAYLDAHHNAGIAADRSLVAVHGLSAEYGYRTAYEFLTAADAPTALIAGANQMVGALRAVRALGLDAPRDISLISIGDTDLAELFTPPLTAVRWDTQRVGKTAAEILISRLNRTGRQGPLQLRQPADLVLRGSCGLPCPRPR